MKIRNEFVKIQNGNKKYEFKNLILNEYLKIFAGFQLSTTNIENVKFDKNIRFCLLKFDTPLENIDVDMKLHNQDFDICLKGETKKIQTGSKNQITMQYDYNDEFIYDFRKSTGIDVKISDYYGRKITAIGFNRWWTNDSNVDESRKWLVCSVLDTSNYNIYLQENQDFVITRKDIITSDAMFYTSNKDKVPYPVHLAPIGVPQIIVQPEIDDIKYYNNAYGILYSIGLSSYPDYIDKEYIIGEDLEAILNENEITITGLENYLSTDSPLFSSKDIYASDDLYPVKTDYKYIIFKYKVWQNVHSKINNEIVTTYTDTGYYYYQSIPINKYGKTNLKIKYERG